MDNIYPAITIIFIAFCMFGVGATVYFLYDLYQLQRISNLIDAEFERYNDFMPSKWDDDWNSYDEIDEPLTPIKQHNEWLLSSNHRDGMEIDND